MSRRFVRVLLVALALAATMGLAFRAIQDELAAERHLEQTRAAARAADLALLHAGDIRAALYAYVAPGQSHEFWTTRAGVLLDGLRTNVGALSAAAETVGQSMAPAAEENLRKLATAEARSRNYVRDDQVRMAADIIFTEARDLIDNLRSQIASSRDAVNASGRTQQVLVRRQQALLAVGALVIWMIVAALLVPLGSEREASISDLATLDLVAPSLAAAATFDRSPPAETEPAARAVTPSIESVAIVPRSPLDLAAAAEVCGALARVSDAQQISSLLARSARVLDASGLIVWLASGDALHPAASWGYDQRLLSRISSVPRDAANLTASALRSNALRTSPADGSAPAAFGVPLIGPAGAVGVLSGEVRGTQEIPESTSAMAAIFAAQLATLVGSIPSRATATESREAEISGG